MKKELGIAVLLVLLCTIGQILNPKFLSQQNLTNTLNLVGVFGVFSIGMGVVIITGGIDLSVGSVFALQGILLAMMLTGFEWPVGNRTVTFHAIPWPIALTISVVGVVLLGIIHGLLITRVRLQPFIVTLCTLMIYRGLARFFGQDEAKSLGSKDYGVLRSLAAGRIGSVPMAFVVLLAVAAVMWVVLHHSVYGRYLFAVGRNEEAARFSGVATKRVIASAYAVCMLLTAISGVLFAFYSPSMSPSQHGFTYELYGIAAAVLGGCSLRGGEGSVMGILLGTILLQVLQNLCNLLDIPSSLDPAVVGAAILITVTLDEVLGGRIRSRLAVRRGFEPVPLTAAIVKK